MMCVKNHSKANMSLMQPYIHVYVDVTTLVPNTVIIFKHHNPFTHDSYNNCISTGNNLDELFDVLYLKVVPGCNCYYIDNTL